MQDHGRELQPPCGLNEPRQILRWNLSLPWLAILVSGGVYAAHFFNGNGSNHLIMDSVAYLQVASGESAGVPFDIRILVPMSAAFMASLTGMSISASFSLLTSLALLTSLLILKKLLLQRGANPTWQTAVLLAFGCSLAVTFGYTPILVDPFLLLITCLTLAALDAEKLITALVLTCIAVLTKEFGLFLAPVWSVYVYRRGSRRFALAGLVPLALLLMVLLVRHSDAAVGFLGWRPYAFHYLFEYQTSVLRLRGVMSYTKLLYMGAWCGVWPILLVATMEIRCRSVRPAEVDVYRIGFAVSLLCLPLLLLGDWSRNLIVLVPFASMVAASNPLARDRYFVTLVAIGGLSTALARPFHGEPHTIAVMLSMTAFSVISSAMIVIRLFQYRVSTSHFPIDRAFKQSAPATIE